MLKRMYHFVVKMCGYGWLTSHWGMGRGKEEEEGTEKGRAQGMAMSMMRLMPIITLLPRSSQCEPASTLCTCSREGKQNEKQRRQKIAKSNPQASERAYPGDVGLVLRLEGNGKLVQKSLELIRVLTGLELLVELVHSALGVGHGPRLARIGANALRERVDNGRKFVDDLARECRGLLGHLRGS